MPKRGGRFVRAWAHNASAHAVLASVLGHHAASWVSVAGLVGVMGIATWRRADLWSAALACFFAEVLLSSTVHPWYLLWALAMLPLRFNTAFWTLSWTVTWSYAAWCEAIPWDLPVWLLMAIYAPVYTLLACQGAYWVWRRGFASSRPG